MRSYGRSASTGRGSTSRRAFLKGSLGTLALAGTFGAFLRHSAKGSRRLEVTKGYGPLRKVPDETTGLELLRLPAGFRYLSYGWAGDEMADGTRTPANHDGMGVIQEAGDLVTLCRNHEVLGQAAFGGSSMTYDRYAGGGCTNLQFDKTRCRWVKSWPTLAGTVKNCAGGPTPWGTWLSCEETLYQQGSRQGNIRYRFEKTHGWIFEVPADGSARPVPLKSMGRFVHEAIAVDPQSGYVYETEDRETSGFYRFIPNKRGKLAAGGRLQMLIAGRQARDLRKGSRIGQTYDVTWVDIEHPQRADVEYFSGVPDRPKLSAVEDQTGVFAQGRRKGGAAFARLEGCWYGNGLVYFNSTSGGKLGAGQVWQFDPKQQQLKLIFESPAREVLDSPDNIAVSPRGGIVLCEDPNRIARLQGMTPDGRLFPFAANHVVLDGQRNGFRGDFRTREWAGATFSRDGEWLFANIYEPGITFAITGPWGEGLL